MVKKGQLFLAGMLLFGLILLTLGFSTLEFESPSETGYTFDNIEHTIRNSAERLSEYRGREFLELYHFFSVKQRQKINSAGNSIELTVVAGFQENQEMKIYTGNFRPHRQKVNLTVNGNKITNRLPGDRIAENSTEIARKYSIKFDGAYLSEEFKSYGNSFLLVAYRFESEDSIRQNTYTS